MNVVGANVVLCYEILLVTYAVCVVVYDSLAFVLNGYSKVE